MTHKVSWLFPAMLRVRTNQLSYWDVFFAQTDVASKPLDFPYLVIFAKTVFEKKVWIWKFKCDIFGGFMTLSAQTRQLWMAQQSAFCEEALFCLERYLLFLSDSWNPFFFLAREIETAVLEMVVITGSEIDHVIWLQSHSTEYYYLLLPR